jgi:hypothetical protein
MVDGFRFCGRGRLRPKGSLINPSPQTPDFFLGQSLTLRRHHDLFVVGPGHESHKPAAPTLPGDERGPALSARKSGGFSIQAQTPFLRIGAVAAQAMLGEERLNLLLKINVPRRGGRQNRARVVGTCPRGQ